MDTARRGHAYPLMASFKILAVVSSIHCWRLADGHVPAEAFLLAGSPAILASVMTSKPATERFRLPRVTEERLLIRKD